jgi:hypothetical protein
VLVVLYSERNGAAVQFADNRHAADDVLERYSMGRLAGPELTEFEEHLLVCEPCQDRLAHEDNIRQRVRDAGAVLQEAPAAGRSRIPKLALALGMAAVGLVVFAGIGWQSFRLSATPPAVILLQTTRGAENPSLAAAPAGKPLTLVLDVTDLQQFSEYGLEVVDAAGHPLFQSAAARQDGKLQATLARGLAVGAYFVRVYTPARELLREYALPVRGRN